MTGCTASCATYGAIWPTMPRRALRRPWPRRLASAGLRQALQSVVVAAAGADRRLGGADRSRTAAPAGAGGDRDRGQRGDRSPPPGWPLPADRASRPDRAISATAPCRSSTTRPARRRPRKTSRRVWRRSFCWRRRWRPTAGFGAEITGVSGELIYWHLSGGYDPGKTVQLFKENAGGDARTPCGTRKDAVSPDRRVRPPAGPICRAHIRAGAAVLDYEHAVASRRR